MKISLKIVLCFFCALMFSDCTRNSYESLDKSPTLATVNGKIITSNQFIEKTKNIQKNLNINMEVFEEKDKLLDDLITTELLYQKAISENMQFDPDIRNYIATKYLKRKVKEASVDESEARKFFEENKANLEAVRASHILKMPAKPLTPQSDEEARKKASDILAKLQAGADFAKLARENSDDPANAHQGGDLGFFPRGKMVKEFDEAVFAMKEIGDISKLVKTRFGYHIIKLTDSRRGFETFRDKIMSRLKLEKERSAYEALIAGIRKDSEIKKYKDELMNLKIVGEQTLLK